MISLLSRIFIKDFKNYSDSKVREQYGVLCGGFGIILNVLLCGLKFVTGTITGSVAMVADAVNNLADAASSIIQILGFKLASKKPDPKHPFGHGRIEYISGLIISFLVLLMGVELFKSSINSIINPEKVSFSIWALIIMVIAILVKLYMMYYNLSVAKKIDSVAMKATATDSFFDSFSTAFVIISFAVSRFTSLPVDGIAGVIVSCFILYGGITSVMETISPLLGDAPSGEFVDQIEQEVMLHKPIVGMHDLVVHDYGPGRKMISLHAEVPGDHDIFELHDVIDVLEFDLSQKFNCEAVIHMDPIDTKNERLTKLKEELKEELLKIHSELSAHDVRMVPGPTHTNLIFDVVKPFECKHSDEELMVLIWNAVHLKHPEIFCVIKVDRPYVN